ncbi:PAS domain-containing sensor histidine kinase [Ideonella oryzae]|uniref:PAS domain S-box protein n=1 Tax=Ideonella oryzae TaxID=2937441 RepID=A0ABT1BII7_9BURK|nr:PAS domain S-box protein [Ideonella oryzae]MCO5975431.1 PAS domain S-box protein [Ideonella oryzae]
MTFEARPAGTSQPPDLAAVGGLVVAVALILAPAWPPLQALLPEWTIPTRLAFLMLAGAWWGRWAHPRLAATAAAGAALLVLASGLVQGLSHVLVGTAAPLGPFLLQTGLILGSGVAWCGAQAAGRRSGLAWVLAAGLLAVALAAWLTPGLSWSVRGLLALLAAAGFRLAGAQPDGPVAAPAPPQPPSPPPPAEPDPAALSRSLLQLAGWGMAMVSLDEDPRIIACNAAFAGLLGHGVERLEDTLERQCVVPACWVALATARAQALIQGSAQVELRHRHRNGHDLATLVHLTVVRDAAGQPCHYLVSVQDIGALKQVQQQALGLATQLHAVLEAMPVGVWIGDAQGQTERINPAVQLLGLYGKSESSCGRGDHESLMRRAVITGEAVRSGLRSVSDAQGAMREIQVTAKPILDARGRVVGVLAVDEDLTEARRSALALRHSSELLERIFNASMAGMALVNEAGEVVRCNLAWRLLVDAMEGQSLLATLGSADLITVREELAAIARGERGTHMGEHAVRRPAAAPAWTSLVLSRLPGENDEQVRLLVQAADVEARRRADEEIAAARLRLTAAQRMAGMGEWQLDVERGTVTCSLELLRLLGYGPSEQVLPRGRWIERMPQEDRATYAAALEQALQGDGRLSIDTRLNRPDGQVMVVHLHAVMQRSGAGKVLMGTLQDVTERKRIEDALRASREQLRALVVYEGQLIEDERKRIAREVHDELGQLVTALRMDLSMLRQSLPEEPQALQRADRMRQTMATMSDVVRHVASHLRPGALDMGLVAAIEWLAEDFSLRWETRCQLELPHEQEPSLPESVALALFRAVQESLTNIAKHAQATQVTIGLEQRGTLLHLTVRDNGRGFDPEVVAARRGGGLGLLGMRERMLAIGAVIDIATGPTGTAVDILYDMDKNPNSP